MNFTEAYGLEIGKYVEKKGKFSYLSWCYAVRFLREHFPAATWRVCENEKGLPLFSMEGGHFVKIELLLGEGESFTQWMPVLNAQNKPIPSPTVFDINTSIQRGLTKCIAMATGIGLGLYAGEDLPSDEKEAKGRNFVPSKDKITTEQLSTLRDYFAMSKTVTEAKLCAVSKIASLEDLESSRYKGAVKWLNNEIGKENADA